MRPLCLQLAVLALTWTRATAVTCRQAPSAATKNCGLPVSLANFQGYYRCENSVQVGRPQSKEEVLGLIAYYDRVKGVGVGHSWWREQFCSGNDSTSINIVMTELESTLNFIQEPMFTTQPNASLPIYVDEAAQTVTVQAGVPQRLLLDFLANFTTASAPLGYSLPAFPWYIDQSIGGAVATGSHGSSMLYGSLASQVVRLELALANGTLANFSAGSNLHLWHAAQVSVGRLGVITELELTIKPQNRITRTGINLPWQEFLEEVMELQENWTGAVAGTNGLTPAQALEPWEGTQLFWFVPNNLTYRVQYTNLGVTPEEAEGTVASASVETETSRGSQPIFGSNSLAEPALSASAPAIDQVEAAEGQGPKPEDAFAQVPTPALGPSAIIARNPLLYNNVYRSIIKSFFPNGTFTNREGILAENEFANRQTTSMDPYDQYEVIVPLSRAGDCLEMVTDTMYAQNLSSGFIVPPLIRFLGAEDAYLALPQGEPQILLNIEDHLSGTTHVDNAPFQQIMGVFIEECKARMHWGKAGWPRWFPCFDGATLYPDTWCDFGCAVQELDPAGKFSSISNVWSWHATQQGQNVPFASCCTTQGFSPSCSCASRGADCGFVSQTGSS